jgi:hypothetical protein
MAFNRQAGGHNFAFGDDVCTKCGMTRPQFQDEGQPQCTGQRVNQPERMIIEDDDDE